MGVLSAAGDRATSEPEEEQPGPVPEQEQPGGDEAAARARAEDGTFVSAEKLKPEQPSRRTRAKEQLANDIDARFKEYETRTATERQQYEQRLRDSDQRWQTAQENLARVQGALEEMRSRHAQPAAPVAPGPDPEALRREGRKALQNNDLDTYEQNFATAARIEAKREAEGMFKPQFEALKADLEKRIPAQIPFEVQQLMMAHRNVAMAGQRGVEAVQLKDRELALYGHQPGPQRMAKAFELADKLLGGMSQTNGRPAGFDQSSAAALSGVPVGGRGANGSGGGEAGVHLTGVFQEAQRKSGMTPEEFVKWSDPHKYGLVR